MNKHDGKPEAPGQQHRLERNKAILLSRDLLNMNDWIVLSCKESSIERAPQAGDATELVSISVIGPGERALMDVLVRPEGAINSELLKKHGCDSAHTFTAPTFAEIHKILNAGFARTRVVTWNQNKVKSILSRLCAQAKLPELRAVYIDWQTEFSHFVSETTSPDDKTSVKVRNLPKQYDCDQPGITPLAECKYLSLLIHEMAGSSQTTEAAAFDKNWSAAFYKPKLGPTQKLKEFLGLDNK